MLPYTFHCSEGNKRERKGSKTHIHTKCKPETEMGGVEGQRKRDSQSVSQTVRQAGRQAGTDTDR